ncbi:hypothetical protein BSG1_02460 [Bacillus sp. SG-1]|nr:hypothetical protein BSG1_02460 [Bacillus sp. SG-1]
MFLSFFAGLKKAALFFSGSFESVWNRIKKIDQASVDLQKFVWMYYYGD